MTSLALLSSVLALTPATQNPDGACPRGQASTLILRVEGCEARLEVVGPADRPALLLALGNLHLQLQSEAAHCNQTGDCHPEADRRKNDDLAAHGKTRPKEFVDYIVWNYTGSHFRQLLDEAPGSPFAEEAAWQLSQIRPPWECTEGPCAVPYLRRVYPQRGEFLTRFPRSARASEVVSQVDKLVRSAVAEFAPGACNPRENCDPSSLEKEMVGADEVLASYATTVQPLAPGLRVSACETAAELAVALKDWPRARSLIACASESKDPAVLGKARALAGQLPH